ncbi:hypothetical protein [Mesorhizobium atlanticum]|jgi:hypothetical protein|uniref:Uncharacterized protein n=1 Tax=Mesorhizobium atlanticum TaxID=2233532 RepID=A0A330H1E1_9HYPH|nr:hypothetical protein [Mesorhizobium atlanticum]RAZ79827.1 hypothetical protein DPM35_00540 [Mesorhizobium atlanticum]
MHKTLKMTLAMAADVPMTLWSMDDLCEKMDTVAPKPGKRRPYKSEMPSDGGAQAQSADQFDLSQYISFL